MHYGYVCFFLIYRLMWCYKTSIESVYWGLTFAGSKEKFVIVHTIQWKCFENLLSVPWTHESCDAHFDILLMVHITLTFCHMLTQYVHPHEGRLPLNNTEPPINVACLAWEEGIFFIFVTIFCFCFYLLLLHWYGSHPFLLCGEILLPDLLLHLPKLATVFCITFEAPSGFIYSWYATWHIMLGWASWIKKKKCFRDYRHSVSQAHSWSRSDLPRHPFPASHFLIECHTYKCIFSQSGFC